MTENNRYRPAGFPKGLTYPEISVFEFLNQTAKRNPNRIAIVFGGAELTYGELKSLSERFASALSALGVRKGDRVAIGLPIVRSLQLPIMESCGWGLYLRH